jgi:hypothetical protein
MATHLVAESIHKGVYHRWVKYNYLHLNMGENRHRIKPARQTVLLQLQSVGTL